MKNIIVNNILYHVVASIMPILLGIVNTLTKGVLLFYCLLYLLGNNSEVQNWCVSVMLIYI